VLPDSEGLPEALGEAAGLLEALPPVPLAEAVELPSAETRGSKPDDMLELDGDRDSSADALKLTLLEAERVGAGEAVGASVGGGRTTKEPLVEEGALVLLTQEELLADRLLLEQAETEGEAGREAGMMMVSLVAEAAAELDAQELPLLLRLTVPVAEREAVLQALVELDTVLLVLVVADTERVGA
jgi:hypothetical protein